MTTKNTRRGGKPSRAARLHGKLMRLMGALDTLEELAADVEVDQRDELRTAVDNAWGPLANLSLDYCRAELQERGGLRPVREGQGF